MMPQQPPQQPPYGYPQGGQLPPSGYGGPHPPQKHANASLSMWLGIASFLSMGVTGIPALIMGLKAKKEILAQPGRFTNLGQATAGVVLGGIGTAMCALWLIGLILPAKNRSQASAVSSASADGPATVATASAAVAPSSPPPPERELGAALTDVLAKTVLGTIHPTGLIKATSKQVSCTPTACSANWDITWEGGLLTRSDFTTSILWTVTGTLGSKAIISNDTSSFTADADDLKKMNEELGEVAASFGPNPDFANDGAPKSKLQELAANSLSSAAFWKAHEWDLWTITPNSETTCEGHAMSEPARESLDTSKMDQFERRQAEEKAKAENASRRQRAAETAAVIKNQTVYFRYHGAVQPKDLTAQYEVLGKDYNPDEMKSGDKDKFPFIVYLSEYDFSKHTYTLVIAAKRNGRWPIGADGSPKIESKYESVSVGTKERTGVFVGGKEVQVAGSNEIGGYTVTNRARLSLPIKMTEDQAKSIAKGADVDVLIVEQPVSARFNKACRRDNIGGVQDVTDFGIGYVLNARTIGYEIRIGGDVVASH